VVVERFERVRRAPFRRYFSIRRTAKPLGELAAAADLSEG